MIDYSFSSERMCNEYFKIFRELVTQLIDLRLKLRSEKKYEMSDMIRDILESSNIQIEDSTDKIEWKIKD